MKLIIKEYLASLREREELDAILPDLLSQLGLTVFSKPRRGTRQNGVDVAAYGSLEGEAKKVYLFSIKAGDLTRSEWDGNTVQSLRPSLNEIVDSYIPSCLPSQYKDEPIIICLCFGGDIQEQVRPQVEGYIKQNSNDSIEFEEWNGDKLAEHILSSFLREELLPKGSRSMLRKSLALLYEPEVSSKHFARLVEMLTTFGNDKSSDRVTAIRQLNICLWILFTWCREANNLEASYKSAELTMLYAWEISKPFLGKKTKAAKAIGETLSSIQFVYLEVCEQYVGDKILPFADKLHAISTAVKPSCKVDVNLKLFDVLGRVAMAGIWRYWQIKQIPEKEKELFQFLKKEVQNHFVGIKQLITNNPVLFSPYKDEQAIDIAIAVWFLALDPNNHKDIHNWLSEMIRRVRFNFNTHSSYTCNLYSYHELIEHPREKTDSYREEVTAGSILYPTIASFAALLGFDDIYKEIQDFKETSLKHCNFQMWYPDEMSEEHFYTNSAQHGATLSNISIGDPRELLEEVFKESEETPSFNEMSAIKYDVWPLVFLGARHHRLPIPVHFLKILRSMGIE